MDSLEDQARVEAVAVLSQFRRGFYDSLTRRADALFELTDAVLCADGPVTSLPELSLAPVFRRGHGALYDALAEGSVDIARLRRTLAGLDLPRDAQGRLWFGVDVTPWPRPDAECSPGRGHCWSPCRCDGTRQTIPGWPYQVVAALERGRSSWTAPLDVVRLGPDDDPTEVTAQQLRDLVGRLRAAGHLHQGDPPILVVLDAGYDIVRLAWLLADLPVHLLGRIRADRVFRGPAPAGRRDGRPGRPPRHGDRFAVPDPATHRPPDQQHHDTHARYGAVRVRAWGRLHPELDRRGGWAGHRGVLPIVEGTVINVTVDRLPGDRAPKPLWLWSGQPDAATADLDLLWRAYIRRFDIEIVCTQVTKPGLGAGRGGRDHVADLHLAVGDHHPVDQQLHQLAALLEPGLVQAHPQLLQHGRHRVGDRAHLDQPLTLGGDLPLAGQQVRLLSGKGPVLALEADQVDHLGQVSLQKPLALACHARPDAAQGRLPVAQLPRHPGAAVGALQRLGDQLRLAEDGAQVRPDQLVELAGGDEPRRAAA